MHESPLQNKPLRLAEMRSLGQNEGVCRQFVFLMLTAYLCSLCQDVTTGEALRFTEQDASAPPRNLLLRDSRVLTCSGRGAALCSSLHTQHHMGTQGPPLASAGDEF